ncbi:MULTISPECIES: lasso peptide biosynthesis B2 protein [unclassified Novosphingobium]|uniref:lasso peptide biosynthesis B2 protein n=1 Tax=unclassified Novosphingobium TaxID=2644732 RepID=UPI00146CE3FB|nr:MULTISPECIES: lasso peptide biosynthesis B2 protein [unclassified Novosphingobium]NMN04818.1 hypothetical protein [Novosphingobium sp. SG919]NMN85188.1 hypothetical protein [Novosphingobium sp. SG916]
MAPSLLRPGLHFCLVGDDPIFLDLVTGRYFRLPDQQAQAFCALVATGLVDRTALLAAGLGELAGAASDPLPLEPCRWSLPDQPCGALADGGLPLPETARALRRQRHFERALARRGLAALCDELAALTAKAVSRPIGSDDAAGRLVRGFQFACFLRTAADRCLPRSLALVDLLARCGWRAHAVLGVRQGPFAAHCWAQAGRMVLNDTPEAVACFIPILAL